MDISLYRWSSSVGSELLFFIVYLILKKKQHFIILYESLVERNHFFFQRKINLNSILRLDSDHLIFTLFFLFIFFFCPHHKIAGPYSVNSILSSCQFVINDFLFIISVKVTNIQLRFDICINHRNLQLRFEFGHSLMIFFQILPLELGKKFSFCSVTFVEMYVWSSDCMYRCFTRKYRSSSNVVMVQWFLTELSLLNLEKKDIFSFHSPAFVGMYV